MLYACTSPLPLSLSVCVGCQVLEPRQIHPQAQLNWRGLTFNNHSHTLPTQKTLHTTTTISFTIMIITLGQQRGCNLCDGRLSSWLLSLGLIHYLSPSLTLCLDVLSLVLCVLVPLPCDTCTHTPHTQTPTLGLIIT